MKKTLIIAAIAAIATLASCNKENVPAQEEQQGPGFYQTSELTLMSAARTKGYVSGALFEDIVFGKLHDATPATTPREMRLSAFLTPQNGEKDNYFVDYVFAKGADGKWHHTPKVFWPIDGSLDFLAYSSLTPFDAKDVTWDEKDASSKVVLNVLEDRLQDDILFCAAQQASADGATPVNMVFNHAQAWVEFQIKMSDAAMAGKMAITGVEIENIYTTGELSITRSGAAAAADWNFRHEVAANFVMPDNYQLYGTQKTAVEKYALTNALDEKARYLDVLLPEQNKTAIVIKYVLAGQPNELAYRFTLGASEKWLMGKKYTYQVTFSTNEITVNPTVLEFDDEGDVSEVTAEPVVPLI